MSKTTRDLKLGAALVSLMLALPAGAMAQDDAPVVGKEALDQVVATVGGTEITMGHMIIAKASLPEQYQQIPDDQLYDGLLRQLIQQEVLSQSEDATDTDLVRLSLENETRSLRAAVAITEVADRAVTDEMVEAAYKRDYVDAEQGKEYNASHILLETEEEAKAVLAEVKGDADFANVAREKSTGPSGPNGGSLGWFGAGTMVAEFQTAVESLNPGDITGPIETQFGWHVIKLNDTRALEAPTLDEVRDQITQQLQQEAVEAHITELTEAADISQPPQTEIDPSLLSATQLLED
ncbi:peptidylprolyl isomerase [Sagittula sp. SSi028]|uniref:peptidylprolyl isomerase n=1 Tax=Sagittula sp. SSi028 TaxID=3400636 RepID=UPI003AF723FA